MRLVRSLALVVLLVASLALAACSSGGSGSASGAELTVSMKDMKFSPKELKVKAGTTVTWSNDDILDHAVVQGEPASKSVKGLFQTSKDLKPGEKFSYKFEKAGQYTVYCSTAGHDAAGMVMRVTVE